MGEVLTDMEESLYKISYVMTQDKKYQCAICCQQFSRVEAVQEHIMSKSDHFRAASGYVNHEITEDSDNDNENLSDHAEVHLAVDGELLEQKIQDQVNHALSNIEKLTQDIVRQEFEMEDSNSNSNSDITEHLQIELKTEVAEEIELNTSLLESVEKGRYETGLNSKKIKCSKGQIEHKCELCENKYPKRHLLKLHMKEHEGDLNYSCDICNKTFTFKQQLNVHRKCHTLERKFKCMTCDKSYKFKQQLNLHVLTHSGVKPFSCETCEKSFTLERQLQSHLKVHTSFKPFVCAQCGKCFKIKQQLQNHELTHYDIKPYVCEICTKAFKLKQQLQNHHKVHEDIKPYCCTACGKAFKFKQQLQNHGKIHEGIKQFPCDFCPKEFMFKQQLQIHMKIHFGIKEFPCHICPKYFRTKQQLQKHLEMHEKRALRLSDKFDDALSEISTLSTTENGGEFVGENVNLTIMDGPIEFVRMFRNKGQIKRLSVSSEVSSTSDASLPNVCNENSNGQSRKVISRVVSSESSIAKQNLLNRCEVIEEHCDTLSKDEDHNTSFESSEMYFGEIGSTTEVVTEISDESDNNAEETETYFIKTESIESEDPREEVSNEIQICSDASHSEEHDIS